jgi:putative component of membrane protein insertase Oxa1/YidC/SpoIIIJ protein YidD
MMKTNKSWLSMNGIKFLFLLTAVFLPQLTNLSAQGSVTEPEAWEPDVLGGGLSGTPAAKPEISMDADLAIQLIRFYQTDINTNSVSRCPFSVSCSNFALQAIGRYGFGTGILFFIDRIYFREHQAAYLYYPNKRNERNQTRLDDTYFLTGKLSDE